MKILLVAGGMLTSPAALLRKITPTAYDCIIAVDHGYDHCTTLGLTPHILMGDLDSVERAPSAQSSALQIIPFAPEKDDTDLRLAAKHALALGASGIDIVCATGGRLDQFMGNLSLLEYLHTKDATLPVRMIDEGNVITLLAGYKSYQNCSKYISMIPIPAEIEFSCTGLKYPATHLTVTRENIISISNECIGDTFTVDIHRGKAYLIQAD